MTVFDHNPLTDSPPDEVPLPNAPLIRVLAQVRFPRILSIEKKDHVAPFQESIRKDYPILRPEQTQGVVLGPKGIVVEHQMVWRFLNEEDTWRVSLAPNFLSLETDSYASRHDFLERLQKVLLALDKHFEPHIVERFGLRYVNRLFQDNTGDLPNLVRPEITGVMATEFGQQVHQTISESLFKLSEGDSQLTTRWGYLPEKATIDPAVVEPVDQISWILDLDMAYI